MRTIVRILQVLILILACKSDTNYLSQFPLCKTFTTRISQEKLVTESESFGSDKIVKFLLRNLWLTFLQLLQEIHCTASQANIRRQRRDTKSGDDDTPTQYTIKDVKVPPDFLRVEYMIGYTFMGTMYGLGFLVLFQSIIVPLTKGLVAIVYTWLLYVDAIQPVTLEEALSQIPPT